MSRLVSFLVLIFFLSRSTYGMDCNFGNSKNILDKIAGTCPRPLFDSEDQTFCCLDIKNDKFYCCNAEEFTLKTGLGIVVPAIIAVVVILSLIISCISCLCCSCCPWYRRRHRGTVYGKVQTPGMVHVIQTPPMRGTTYVVQNASTPHPMNSSEIQRQSSQRPRETYAKQAPYNPHYV